MSHAMTDIPEDVMKVAEGIAGCIPPRVQKVNREFAAIVIARTILTDRAAQAERMARLEEALRPFAQAVVPDPECVSGWRFGITPKPEDFYAARRALSQEGSEPS